MLNCACRIFFENRNKNKKWVLEWHKKNKKIRWRQKMLVLDILRHRVQISNQLGKKFDVTRQQNLGHNSIYSQTFSPVPVVGGYLVVDSQLYKWASNNPFLKFHLPKIKIEVKREHLNLLVVAIQPPTLKSKNVSKTGNTGFSTIQTLCRRLNSQN